MNKSELKLILDKHKLWLEDDPAGARANLIAVPLARTALSFRQRSNPFIPDAP